MSTVKAQGKVIWSYTIYGVDEAKYYESMHKNIAIARSLEVKIVVSTNEKNRKFVENYFSEYADTVTVLTYDFMSANVYPKLLRYLVPLELKADYYFYKDSDSVVTTRELECMDSWLNEEDCEAMIMRDHPLHIAPILGGMFGLRHVTAKLLADRVDVLLHESNMPKMHHYWYDQVWLAYYFYPLIAGLAKVYTAYFYYVGEDFIRIKRDDRPLGHIGAQLFRDGESDLPGNNFYKKLYGDGLLCLPFYLCISSLYQRVRPTLTAAVVYRFLH